MPKEMNTELPPQPRDTFQDPQQTSKATDAMESYVFFVTHAHLGHVANGWVAYTCGYAGQMMIHVLGKTERDFITYSEWHAI